MARLAQKNTLLSWASSGSNGERRRYSAEMKRRWDAFEDELETYLSKISSMSAEPGGQYAGGTSCPTPSAALNESATSRAVNILKTGTPYARDQDPLLRRKPQGAGSDEQLAAGSYHQRPPTPLLRTVMAAAQTVNQLEQLLTTRVTARHTRHTKRLQARGMPLRTVCCSLASSTVWKRIAPDHCSIWLCTLSG